MLELAGSTTVYLACGVTSIKILQWDGSGFWILMKRLDKNCFRWPDTPDELQKVTLKEMH